MQIIAEYIFILADSNDDEWEDVDDCISLDSADEEEVLQEAAQYDVDMVRFSAVVLQRWHLLKIWIHILCLIIISVLFLCRILKVYPRK